MPEAAVPWDLYGLKIVETQLALQPIVLFLRTVSRAQRRRLGGRLLIFGGSRPKRIPTLPFPCEEEATCARTRIHSLDDEPTIERTSLLGAEEIVIAFSRDSLLKGTLMAQRESALFTVTPGSLSGLAVIFLLLAAFFALSTARK